MIERKIIEDKLRQVLVEDFLAKTLEKVGYSHTVIHKTPLGEKVIIHASRPGLIVGSKGSNVKKLTKLLKTRFNFENPQIEIEEITDPRLDPKLVAENIASALERFGLGRFKAEGYKAMENAIQAGALGIEVLISGKIPSARAKRWRFYKGYLKKCGDAAVSGVLTAYCIAKLKPGIVGIQVRIMPPNLILPDKILFDKTEKPTTEESSVEISEEEHAKEVAAAQAEAPKEDKQAKKPRAKKADGEKSEKAARKPRAKKAEEKPADN